MQYVKGRLCLPPLHARVLNSETGVSTLTPLGHPLGIEKIVRPSMRLQWPFFFQRKLIADTRDEVPSRDYPGVHALHPAYTECPACKGSGRVPMHHGLRGKECPPSRSRRHTCWRHRSTVVDPDTQAIAARMIENKIRDEWVTAGGTANYSAIVSYSEETGEWEARPTRDDLTLKDRRAFVTAVNRVIHRYRLVIKVKLAPPL